ncbi:MAG: hypothetical protein WCK98_08120 [bacterium]
MSCCNLLTYTKFGEVPFNDVSAEPDVSKLPPDASSSNENVIPAAETAEPKMRPEFEGLSPEEALLATKLL